MSTAALVAGAGNVNSASAADDYWVIGSLYLGYGNGCLTASATTNAVFTHTCEGWQAQDWEWVGIANSRGEQRLVSRTRGMCLATDNKSDRNAVWLSSCDTTAGQYWKWDNANQYLRSNWTFGAHDQTLRASSPGSGSVYSSGVQNDETYLDIPERMHVWYKAN
ncbi:ricin-type beta-trefoil lectin domain protein [Streptomyces sp. NBC_01477]|uniref:ricin-type beta-trefoil lectin domain protein n=1 Tax=Streptomyces sp. NBC_01477 TaxID=2976015 RepID=UPI002E310CDF|nr:ricin-type beta-trefoil lectin domain protein [Streptomyces sp. NBC_01477]